MTTEYSIVFETPELIAAEGNYVFSLDFAISPLLKEKARIQKVDAEIDVLAESLESVRLEKTAGWARSSSITLTGGDGVYGTYSVEMALDHAEAVFTELNTAGAALLTVQVYSGTMTALKRVVFRVTYFEEHTLDYHDGSEWKTCIPYCFTGTEWVQCIPYYFDGEKWVEISTTS